MSSPNLFSPAPSLTAATNTTVVDSIPDDADAVGVMLTPSGEVPEKVGFSRDTLTAYGFKGKAGETFMVPSSSGAAVVAVGLGDDEADFRRAGAAFSRACGRLGSLALVVDDTVLGDGDPGRIAEALVEGALLARYSYSALKSEPDPSPVPWSLPARCDGCWNWSSPTRCSRRGSTPWRKPGRHSAGIRPVGVVSAP